MKSNKLLMMAALLALSTVEGNAITTRDCPEADYITPDVKDQLAKTTEGNFSLNFQASVSSNSKYPDGKNISLSDPYLSGGSCRYDILESKGFMNKQIVGRVLGSYK